MPGAKHFFTSQEKEQLLEAIKKAEKTSSGEIRLHLEERCPGNVLDRAAYIFEKLGMTQTAARNGVLIYLAVKDRKFAVIGDKGINAVVEEHFWEDIKHLLAEHFKRGEYLEGLLRAIERTGYKLKKHFPFNEVQDHNELPDEISFS